MFDVVMQRKVDAHRAKTHKNEDSVGISLPAIGHLVVFFFRGLGVHREERP